MRLISVLCLSLAQTNDSGCHTKPILNYFVSYGNNPALKIKVIRILCNLIDSVSTLLLLNHRQYNAAWKTILI